LGGRIIALSNSPLADLVVRKAFSANLYEQIGGTRIYLAPLRSRPTDVALIMREFVSTFKIHAIFIRAIDDEAVSLLCGYDWPGNSRQLLAIPLRAVGRASNHLLTADEFGDLAGLRASAQDRSRLPVEKPETPATRVYSEDGHMRSLEEIEADVIRLAKEALLWTHD
jgi:DNA-binding NtrC family response regulator